MGLNPSTVDFGQRGDLDPLDPLRISIPGNCTDEEGFAVFHGWPGQDLDHITVTQRSFANRYAPESPGQTGRWMVIDYHLTSSISFSTPLYIIQMMDIDLGSPGDDMFSWVPENNMTVVHQGSTYIGLALFHFGGSYYFGHNAGEMGPSVFDGEDRIFTHMSSPNDQVSSTTQQNWYMDLIVKVPANDVGLGCHVAFAIVVGSSIDDLRSALSDARTGLTGEWSADPPTVWQRNDIEYSVRYEGPILNPSGLKFRKMERTSDKMEWSKWYDAPFSVVNGSELKGVAHTSTVGSDFHIGDWGTLEFNITSNSVWESPEPSAIWQIKVDNLGPTIEMHLDPSAPKGTLRAIAIADDRGGSGVAALYMKFDNGPFQQVNSLSATVQGSDLRFDAYAEDICGNLQTASLENLINDIEGPTIYLTKFDPEDITEKTTSGINFSIHCSDSISAVNSSTARFKWGIGSPTSPWTALEASNSDFMGSITNDWEASQSKDLIIDIEVKDTAGNIGTKRLTERIDPIDDPPSFIMQLTASPWEREHVGIQFIGSEPDGQEVTFKMDYRTGAMSEFTSIPDNSLRELDGLHYLFTLPKMVYEGSLWIRATASDGKLIQGMPQRNVSIDKKSPSLVSISHPGSAWLRTHSTIQVSSADGGSGVGSTWFEVKRGTAGERVEGNELALIEDGSYDITAFSEDWSGNRAELKIAPVRIDMTPIEIIGASVSPERPGPSDDLNVSFDFRETGSGPFDLEDRVASEFFSVSLTIDNGTPIRASSMTSPPGPSTIVNAFFTKPFEAGQRAFSVSITGRDIAQNEASFFAGPFGIGGEPPTCPVQMQFPGSVGVGEDFTMMLSYDGEVLLEVSYPNTTQTWMVPPFRTKGIDRNYSLPAPYDNGKVLFRVFYGDEGSSGPNRTCPPLGWYEIVITGWRDSDRDGLSDAWEREYGFDPASMDDPGRDDDDDGMGLLSELRNLTSVVKKDTDKDGMDDRWEAMSGTLPFLDDGSEDPDMDGWSNLAEFRGQTDPRDRLSHPEEPPATPWYWILIIVGALLAVLGYFVAQLFRRRKLERDLREFDEEVSWKTGK